MVFFRFKNIRTFIFDLDGTVWRWTYLLPGMAETINKLQDRGKKVLFITNNAVLSRRGFAQKLTDLGIKTEPRQVFSAGYVAARYFQEKGIGEVYPVGEKGLVEEMNEVGIEVTKDARAVILTTDRNFSYWKLKTVYDLVTKKNAGLFTTGHGLYWHVGKEIYPGDEIVVKAVETLTGRSPINIGKPSDIMKARLLTDVTFYPLETLLIGDEPKSDIVFGNRCGFKTALALTGATTEEETKDLKGAEKPNVILRDPKELIRGW